MNYGEAFLEKVRAFGVLGYPSHEITYLVDPEDPAQFEKDILDKKSELYKAFQKGKMTGQYTMDKSLFDAAKASNIDANQKLNERQYLKKIDAAIYQHFNL